MDAKYTTCSNCKGWGLNPFPPDDKSNTCDVCNGTGLEYVLQSEKVIWDLPNYYDFNAHSRLKFKILITALITIAFVGAIVTIFVILLLRATSQL